MHSIREGLCCAPSRRLRILLAQLHADDGAGRDFCEVHHGFAQLLFLLLSPHRAPPPQSALPKSPPELSDPPPGRPARWTCFETIQMLLDSAVRRDVGFESACGGSISSRCVLCVDDHPLHGSHCMDPTAWIPLHGSHCMDPTAWIPRLQDRGVHSSTPGAPLPVFPDGASSVAEGALPPAKSKEGTRAAGTGGIQLPASFPQSSSVLLPAGVAGHVHAAGTAIAPAAGLMAASAAGGWGHVTASGACAAVVTASASSGEGASASASLAGGGGGGAKAPWQPVRLSAHVLQLTLDLLPYCTARVRSRTVEALYERLAPSADASSELVRLWRAVGGLPALLSLALLPTAVGAERDGEAGNEALQSNLIEQLLGARRGLLGLLAASMVSVHVIRIHNDCRPPPPQGTDRSVGTGGCSVMEAGMMGQ
jgi:hypothetical protein